MQGRPGQLPQLSLPLLWDVSPLVTPNTRHLTVPHWCLSQAELWLAVDNGLKAGDSRATVTRQPCQTDQ